jgi:hypothetical protein
MGKFKKRHSVTEQYFRLTKIKVALLSVWTIVSIVTTFILLLPFLVDRQTILKDTPTCISKKQFNIECSLCGMTRAFIEISNGHIKNAVSINKGSIFFYTTFLVNAILIIFYATNKFLHRKKLAIDDS